MALFLLVSMRIFHLVLVEYIQVLSILLSPRFHLAFLICLIVLASRFLVRFLNVVGLLYKGSETTITN